MHVHRSAVRPALDFAARALALAGLALAGLALAGLPAHAAEPTPGNLLVTFQDNLYELTPAGTQIQLLAIDSVSETARDVVLDRSGLAAIYNGTFSPQLSLLEPVTVSWAHLPFTGWSTVNNVSYGGVAAYRHYVFATDMTTAGDGGTRGIVRFDLDTATGVRFGDAEYIDVAMGFDGKVYGLRSDEQTVDAFDPESLAAAGGATLALDVRGIAVDADGEILGASWDGNLYRFSSAGGLLDFHSTGIDNLTDIDLSPSGAVAAGARFGEVIVSTAALDSSTSFDLTTDPGGGQQTFVAFVDDPRIFADGFESGDLASWSRVVSD